VALILLMPLIVVMLGGCLTTKTSLTISGDDRVSGEVLIATQTVGGQAPFRPQPPEELADRVHITPYSANGRSGSQLSFNGLTFQETEQLSQALGPSGTRYRMRLSRAGSLVTFEASADLTPLANTDSSFVVEVSAPGEITTTNGQESAGVVSWAPEPGEVTQMSATYQFSGSNNQEWFGWAVLLGGLTLGVAILVAVLAQQAHERARRASGDRGA
jgi:hypothetical protein